MPVKKVKNTSPARRQMSTLTYEEITSSKPRKQLVKGKKQNAGRNNGTISIRHRGGGGKRRLRDVDFNRASK